MASFSGSGSSPVPRRRTALPPRRKAVPTRTYRDRVIVRSMVCDSVARASLLPHDPRPAAGVRCREDRRRSPRQDRRPATPSVFLFFCPPPAPLAASSSITRAGSAFDRLVVLGGQGERRRGV